MKKFLLFSCLMAILHIPISCDECGDDTPTVIYYEISEIGVSSLFMNKNFNWSPDSTVSFSESILRMYIRFNELNTALQIKEPAKFSFIPSATACDPGVIQVPTQSIEAIEVFSENAVYANGTTYEPGDDLMELFTILSFYNEMRRFDNAADFITAQNAAPEQFLSVDSNNIILRMKQAPDRTINQIFTINLKYSNEPDPLMATTNTRFYKKGTE